MTTPNTTARQAGLTEALHYLQMGIANLELGNGVHTVDFRNAERAILAAHSADARNGEGVALPMELRGIAEAVASGKGFWTPCTGCYDTEDGRPTQKYAHSAAFGCEMGCGCSECGGLGVVWDDTDYEEMARFMAANEAAPAAQAPTEGFSAAVHQVRGALELCEPEDLAAFDFIIAAITPTPAPAAQADEFERSYDMALERLVLARQFMPTHKQDEFDQAWEKRRAELRSARQQSATPVEIVHGETYRARSARLSAGRINWQERAAIELMYATPAVPVAWLRDDGGDAITSAKKTALAQSNGLPGARVADTYSTPLYRATPADAASEADKRDAERYRWLREQAYRAAPCVCLSINEMQDEDWPFQDAATDLDCAIDAAIQRERQQGAEDA